MADIEIGNLPNGFVKSASPTASGEVKDLNYGGLPGGNVGDAVNPLDIVNLQTLQSATSNVVTAAAALPVDNILLGDGAETAKDSGVTISSLQFDQSLNTTDSPTFAALTTTGGVTIGGPSTKDSVLSNFSPSYSFIPTDQVPPYGSGTRKIALNYLGTYKVNRGSVDIILKDNITTAHGSSTFIRITRHFGQVPTVQIHNNGNQFANYIFFYRTTGTGDSNVDFELFFQTTSSVGTSVTFDFNIAMQGSILTTVNSDDNDDTFIFPCRRTLCTFATGETQICGAYNFLPHIVETADFTALVYTVLPSDYWIIYNTFPVGGQVQLPNATITSVDGRNYRHHVNDASISTGNPLTILPFAGETINGSSSFLMTIQKQTLDTGFVFSQNDHKINNDYPLGSSVANNISSLQDLLDKYTLSGTDILIPNGVDLNPTTFVDITGHSIRPSPNASIGILGYGSNATGFTTTTPGASLIPLIFMPDQCEVRISDCKISATGTAGVILDQRHSFSLFQMLNNVEATIGKFSIGDFALFAATSCFLKLSTVVFSITPGGSGVVKITQTTANPDDATITLEILGGISVPQMALVEFGGLSIDGVAPGLGQFLKVNAGASVGSLNVSNSTFKTLAASAFNGVDETTDYAMFHEVFDDAATFTRRESVDNITVTASNSSGVGVASILTTATDIGGLGLPYSAIAGNEKFTLASSVNGGSTYNGNGGTYSVISIFSFQRTGAAYDITLYHYHNGAEVPGSAQTVAALNTRQQVVIESPLIKLGTGDGILPRFQTSAGATTDFYQVTTYIKRA